MLVIVGHGPGLVGKGLGPWLDTQTVVRLKWAERPNVEDWGTRTDHVCASHPSFFIERQARGYPPLQAEFWFLPEKFCPPIAGTRQGAASWLEYYQTCREQQPGPRKSLRKASTGLKAIFCALEFLKPVEIGLLGFDMVLHPEVPTFKWNTEPGKYSYAHDAQAEHRAIMGLPVKITEL